MNPVTVILEIEAHAEIDAHPGIVEKIETHAETCPSIYVTFETQVLAFFFGKKVIFCKIRLQPYSLKRLILPFFI